MKVQGLAATRSALGLLVVVGAAASAGAQGGSTEFRILPGSQYSYFVSGFSQVPDCDGNDDRQCDFGVTGTFTLEESGTGTAAIVDAVIELTSPVPVDPILPGQIVTGERVAEWLEMQELVGIPSIPSVVAYQSTTAPGLSGPFTVVFDIPGFGDGGVMTGGTDARFVDGDGLEFTAALRRIPEPASLWLITLSCLPLALRVRASRMR